jgi:diguanylate cyclase (GGDEF)-like protein/PAS domain S-box-containing protein
MAILDKADLLLIMLSVLVAIFASYTALSLSGRIIVAENPARRWWIFAAALALGGGTWSMHFVGMLAMAMPTSYDLYLTLGSLLLVIVVMGVGLGVISKFGARGAPLALSGLLVGSGIVAMHYIGMAAMRMPGLTITYNWTLVSASILIALAAATAALWMAFSIQDTPRRLGAALVMGIAISGMHYTGMAAVRFVGTQRMSNIDPSTIPPSLLAIGVAGTTSFLLLLALITAFFDNKLATLTAREADVLMKSEERYRSLIESASDIIGILDCNGRFIYESSSALQVLGYRSEEIVGKQLIEIVAPHSIDDAHKFLDSILKLTGASTVVELSLINKGGGQREFEIVATNLLQLPTIGGIVVNLRDITERTQLVAQLEILSDTDLLTGALNRRGFNRLAERQFERSRELGQALTVVMIDVDHFKRVNDVYGHAAGDLVLAKIADACRAQAGEDDLLGRMGGEEFAILIAHGGLAEAHGKTALLQAAISATTVSTIRGPVSVTASFGIAHVDPFVVELPLAIIRADDALYAAKNAGRDCIRVAA